MTIRERDNRWIGARGVIFFQLAAMRNLCMSMVKSIDILMAAMDNEDDETQAMADEPSFDPNRCTHPLSRRIPIPVMGPKKFKCMDCNEDVLEDSLHDKHARR